MFYVILASCIVGAILSYPLIYNTYIFPREMEKFNGYIRSEQADLALSILNGLPQKKKATLEVHLAYWEAHTMKKHWYLALFHLNEIIQKKLYIAKTLHPNGKVDIHLKKAKIYENIDKSKSALQEYLQILKHAPKHLIANMETGKCYFNMKKYDAALVHLQEAFSQDQQNIRLAELLSDTHGINNDYINALAHIQQALKHSNGEQHAYGYCRLRHKEVRILFKLERYPEAISVGKSIDHHYAKLEEVQTIMGIAHRELGQFSDASKLFRSSLSKYVNDYSSITLKARYYYSEMLIEDGDLITAVMQMSFIQKGHKAYEETDERLAVYKAILEDKKLSMFFSKVKPTDAALILSELFTEENVAISGTFSQFSTNDHIYINNAELSDNHEKILIVFNMSFKHLDHHHIEKILRHKSKDEFVSKLLFKTIYLFSLFSIDPLIIRKIEKIFAKVVVIEGERLLVSVKNKKVFFNT